LVPRDALQNALSLNAATFTGAALIGPAIAGALLDVIGPAWLFAMNAVSFLAVLFALFAMRAVPKHVHEPQPLRDAIFGGFAYAAKEKWILGALALSAVGALFARSYQQLLPYFADDVFDVGSRGYGFLLAGGGGGALFGALALSALPDIAAKGRLMIVSGLAMAATLAAFTFTRSFALAIALVVVLGVTSTAFTTMIATMIQLGVPGPLRGRVISLYVSTLIGLPSLGALAIAGVGKVAGVPRALLYGAIVTVVALVAAAGKYLRERDR
jgi:predicted MFS family arabinose efflux permease